jgi:hypothetical protein
LGLEQWVSTVAPYRGSKMGKYMRKGKGVGEVAVMVVAQGSLGVRTRATNSSQKIRITLWAIKSFHNMLPKVFPKSSLHANKLIPHLQYYFLKKSSELSVLLDGEVVIIIFSETDMIHKFASDTK